jgi:SAM-dependent methyltransferase
MSETARCPACHGGDVHRDAGDWRVGTQQFGLARCGSCRSSFTAPLPSDQTLQDFYRQSFDYRWYRDHYGAKLRDSRMRVQEYRALLGQRVLDFGGGLGYFSAAARQAGLESITMDPYVAGSSVPLAAWDCVVALHALEHSNDAAATLAQIKRYLRPGGRVILAVPNFDGLGYRRLGMRWVWAQPPLMHVFHFTAAGLTALLARCGFTELHVSYHERWDANTYADVEHEARFRRWDALWGARGVNGVPLFRKVVAALNARRRFAALEHALQDYRPDNADYAELQVTGVLRP